MANNDIEKEMLDTADVTPETAVTEASAQQAAEAVEKIEETAAEKAEEAVEEAADTAAEKAEEAVEEAAEGAKKAAPAAAVMRAEDDEADSRKELTRKQKKELDKIAKERRKQYHVSNFDIIRNYRNYGEAEKKHYRYIFGQRIASKVWPVFRFLILFGLGFVVMYPMLYMISCAIRPQAEMNDPSIVWIPKTFTLSNLQQVWNEIEYPALVWRTFYVNIICCLLQVVTCSITGYGFARFKFKGKGILFMVVILQIIVPVQIILIPQFMQFRYFDIFGIITAITGNPLNLTDNPVSLYMQAFFCNGIRAGLFILLFRQFFRGLPKELEDAAHLDGCGPFATFVRIMIPNARTSYLTVFIFSLVWYWNDTYVTGMFYDSSTTIALEVGNLFNTMSTALNGGQPTGVPTDYIVWIEAGCLLSILPIVIIYCFLQKYFIEGIERSGITGT